MSKDQDFREIDLVAHDGGNPRGDFCQTLDVTDVLTGWTQDSSSQKPSER
jgi:hypothetical protein